MDKTYIIIETKDITDSMIEESINTGEGFRKSKDCLCSLLKFDTKYPDTMAGHKKYTHAEIVQYIIDNPLDWDLEEI